MTRRRETYATPPSSLSIFPCILFIIRMYHERKNPRTYRNFFHGNHNDVAHKNVTSEPFALQNYCHFRKFFLLLLKRFLYYTTLARGIRKNYESYEKITNHHHHHDTMYKRISLCGKNTK